MTVGAEKLVRMAEQIAANISTNSDTDVVAGELVAHLQRFWDPRMLSAFLSDADSGGTELSPVVAAAIEKLKSAA